MRKNRRREGGNRVKRGVRSVIAEPNRLLSPVKGVIVVLLLVGMTGMWCDSRTLQFPHERSRQVYEELGKFDGGNEAKRLDWVEMYEFQAGNNYTGQWTKG